MSPTLIFGMLPEVNTATKLKFLPDNIYGLLNPHHTELIHITGLPALKPVLNI
jgi:hypothetical protein